jgi:Tol biopolymer transport system component
MGRLPATGSLVAVALVLGGAVAGLRVAQGLGNPAAGGGQATGGTIAFLRNGRLWLMNADGSLQRSTGFHATDYPGWSPDARRIAFNSGGRLARIWVGDPRRRSRRPLTPVSSYDCMSLSWSPNGRRIAYTTNLGCEGQLAIFLVNRDGTSRRRLRPGYGHVDQAWSPDGRFILFASYPPGRPNRTRFSIVPVDGGRRRALPVYGSTSGSPRRPVAVWARNGMLYFGGGGSVMRIKLNGTGRRVLSGDLDVLDFSLSPDQRRIAFSATDGRIRDIYVMNADGTQPRKLTNERGVINSDPQWSPDGGRIAFVRRVGANGTTDIYLIDADGGNLTNLTKNPAEDTAPAWAPKS